MPKLLFSCSALEFLEEELMYNPMEGWLIENTYSKHPYEWWGLY